MILNLTTSTAFNTADYTIGVNEDTTITHELVEQQNATELELAPFFWYDYYVYTLGVGVEGARHDFQMAVGDKIKYTILSIEENEVTYSLDFLNESQENDIESVSLFRGYFDCFAGERIIHPMITTNIDLIEEEAKEITKNGTHFTVGGRIDSKYGAGLLDTTYLVYSITYTNEDGIAMYGKLEYIDRFDDEIVAYASIRTVEVDKVKSSNENGLNLTTWQLLLGTSFFIPTILSIRYLRRQSNKNLN
jgi:hypothetical protein